MNADTSHQLTHDARKMANELKTLHWLRTLHGLKPLLLLVGIAAAVAAGVTVVLWSRGPTYSLLYANLGAEDQAQITQALDAAQIPYRLAARAPTRSRCPPSGCQRCAPEARRPGTAAKAAAASP